MGILSLPRALSGAILERAHKHSVLEMLTQVISVGAGVSRSGNWSGRAAGGGKWVRKKTSHFSYGITADLSPISPVGHAVCLGPVVEIVYFFFSCFLQDVVEVSFLCPFDCTLEKVVALLKCGR